GRRTGCGRRSRPRLDRGARPRGAWLVARRAVRDRTPRHRARARIRTRRRRRARPRGSPGPLSPEARGSALRTRHTPIRCSAWHRPSCRHRTPPGHPGSGTTRTRRRRSRRSRARPRPPGSRRGRSLPTGAPRDQPGAPADIPLGGPREGPTAGGRLPRVRPWRSSVPTPTGARWSSRLRLSEWIDTKGIVPQYEPAPLHGPSLVHETAVDEPGKDGGEVVSPPPGSEVEQFWDPESIGSEQELAHRG